MIKTKFHSKSSDLPSVFFGTTYRSPALWVKINASRPVYWQHLFKGCLSIQVQFISSWRALLRHSGLKIRIESVLIGVITQHRVFEVGTVLSFAFMGCWLIYLILHGKDKITAEWWECLSVSVGGFTMSGITPHKECVWLCAPKPAVTHHWLQSVFTSLASAASLWKVSKHWENNTSTWQTPLSNIFKVFNFQLSPPPKKKKKISLASKKTSIVTEVHLSVDTGVWEHHFLIRQQFVSDSELLQLGREVISAFHHWCILDSAVGEGHAVGGGFIRAFPPTAADLAESGTKLLRHGIVDDWVDGAVEVDADFAEKHEPAVQIGLVQEGVDHHQSAVRHPEQGEEDYHHCQHLGHLQWEGRRNMRTAPAYGEAGFIY